MLLLESQARQVVWVWQKALWLPCGQSQSQEQEVKSRVQDLPTQPQSLDPARQEVGPTLGLEAHKKSINVAALNRIELNFRHGCGPLSAVVTGYCRLGRFTKERSFFSHHSGGWDNQQLGTGTG